MGSLTDSLASGVDTLLLGVWNALCDFLTAVLGMADHLGTFSADPQHSAITPLWAPMVTVSVALALILFFLQLTLGVLAPRRHLAYAVTGPVRYVVALAVAAAVVTAVLDLASGITDLLLTDAGHFPAGAGVGDAANALDLKNLPVDTARPVVLALLGIVAILPLALGFALELLFRQCTILVLVASLPVTAAGLTALSTRHWFWRATRWLLAAIFMQPTFAMVLVIGLGILRGAGPDTPAGASGGTGLVSLVVGIGVLFVALFAPWSLFRLFSFVEPGTTANEMFKSAFADARGHLSDMRSLSSGAFVGDTGATLAAATGGRWEAGTPQPEPLSSSAGPAVPEQDSGLGSGPPTQDDSDDGGEASAATAAAAATAGAPGADAATGGAVGGAATADAGGAEASAADAGEPPADDSGSPWYPSGPSPDGTPSDRSWESQRAPSGVTPDAAAVRPPDDPQWPVVDDPSGDGRAEESGDDSEGTVS